MVIVKMKEYSIILKMVFNSYNDYYGVFYYKEPESKCFLSYNNSRSYKNKYEAFIYLKDEINKLPNVKNIDDINEFMESDFIGCRILRGEIDVKENLMYTPIEMYNFLKENNLNNKLIKVLYEDEHYLYDDLLELFPENKTNFLYWSDDQLKEDYPELTSEERKKHNFLTSKLEFYKSNWKLASSIPQIPKFCGKWLGMYGIEDIFDQILSLIGKELNIDIIIFEKSVGNTGYVTEILDCREKIDSYNSLIFT